MKITTSIIRAIEPQATISCDSQEFDYVDVTGFATKPDTRGFERVLWCATRSSTPTDLSWHGVAYNRLEKLAALPSDKWVVVTDDPQALPLSRNPTVLVPNVAVFAQRVYEHVLREVAPQVIGVTGTVGKTTCVGMIEHLFSEYGKTLRLYAKRITPLSLFEMVINGLENDHRYIAMEYAMFHRWHIAALAELLPPSVGVLLNLEPEHLEIDGIRGEQDILEAKLPLLRASQYPFVERDVATRFPDALSGIPVFDWSDYVEVGTHRVRPFIDSKLQFIQIGAALKAKEALLGPITPSDISNVEGFKPVEHRLERVEIAGRAMFFDGEVTSAVRLKAMAESMYPTRGLVLHDVQFYGDARLQEPVLRKALAQFGVVYVSHGLKEEFKELIDSCLLEHTRVVRYHSSLPEPPPNDLVLFVHWGTYWRQHKDAEAAQMMMWQLLTDSVEFI